MRIGAVLTKVVNIISNQMNWYHVFLKSDKIDSDSPCEGK